MKRRSLIIGGAAALGLGWWLRPQEQGANHSPYFQQLSAALDQAQMAKPTLVVDRQRLLENIRTLRGHIKQRFDYRIVVKSLPSLPLLELVMEASGSTRLMVFHQPFLNQVAAHFPQADVLLGKPMPVVAAHNFYRNFAGGGFDPAQQLRWLLDTPERVTQYAALAQGLGQAMLEGCVYDPESGQLLTGSYMDYTMPRADDLPSFSVDHTVTPCTHNQIGRAHV